MHTEVVIHLMNAYEWCWSKICGSQWEVMKVKFLINSNMTLTDSKVQQDFIGQGHYSKVKGQIKVRS